MEKWTQAPHNRETAFVARVLITGFIVTLFFVAWHLRNLFMLVFGALLVAVILQLVARLLHERFKLPYRAALAVAILLAAAVLAFAFALFRSEVADQTQALSHSFLARYKACRHAWSLGTWEIFPASGPGRAA